MSDELAQRRAQRAVQTEQARREGFLRLMEGLTGRSYALVGERVTRVTAPSTVTAPAQRPVSPQSRAAVKALTQTLSQEAVGQSAVVIPLARPVRPVLADVPRPRVHALR